MENYYINKFYNCPITHIILENKKSNEYKNYTEIKINEDKYLYFTNNNKYDQLYEYSNQLKDKLNLTYNKNGLFDYTKFGEIKNNEYLKIYNSITNFYHYNKYTNFICLIIYIFSFIYLIIEPEKSQYLIILELLIIL